MISVNFDLRGSDALMSKLKHHPELIARSAESVLKQEARSLAVNYGAVTYPVGMKEGSGGKQAKRIVGDVKRLFPTDQEAWRVFEMIKQKDAVRAKGFWHAYKSDDEKRMKRMMRGIPRGLDASKHQAARVKGKVPVKAEPISMATSTRQGNYSRKVLKKRGIAKAGWFVAAKSLGGRVRTGKGKQRFPKYVRAHGRRAGIGGSRFKGGTRASVKIWNSVNYIDWASNFELMEDARLRAQVSFREAMERAVHFANKRKFKSVA